MYCDVCLRTIIIYYADDKVILKWWSKIMKGTLKFAPIDKDGTARFRQELSFPRKFSQPKKLSGLLMGKKKTDQKEGSQNLVDRWLLLKLQCLNGTKLKTYDKYALDLTVLRKYSQVPLHPP